MATRFFIVMVIVSLSASCTTAPVAHAPQNDLGLQWVKHAAEYEAVTRQVYQSATAALPGFVNDKTWSALPEHPADGTLPPAVVLDIDETVVNNIDFQISHERPFTNRKLYDFYEINTATAVPGAIEFIAAAMQAGVELFFITNRPCEIIDDESDPCPQKRAMIKELASIGIRADDRHVLLADRPGWDRAKVGRRQHVAKTHRVIMLIGDELGDFVPCVRTKLYGPCTRPATKESRLQLVEQYAEYWGNGWYILPGPTHGTWTSFR